MISKRIVASKPVVHLAYAVPLGRTLFRRAVDKAIRLAGVTPLYRKAHDTFIPWQHPVRAPHSITRNLLKGLRSRGYDVRLYSLYERTVANVGPDDIFIGFPLPSEGLGEKRSASDDRGCITSRTIREHPSERNFILMPYAHDAQYSLYARNLIQENNSAGGGVMFIGGKIWERDWETKSPLADLGTIRKTHITDMGIDVAEYPTAKKSFNPKGQRKYLYIGHTAWYKNTKELERIAATMPQHEFAHIGGGEVMGWKKLASFATLTPEYMKKLASEYDFFVNVSTADPQATTIVEQMCFGLAIACTPETGYDYPTLTELRTHDTEHNVRALLELQNADAEDLLARTRENRRIAEEKHGWGQFTDKVLDFAGIR